MKTAICKTALAVSTALTANFGIGTPAMAQTSESTRNTSVVDEIIVTARRVEERVQDVPISITVFNQEQLTSRNIISSSDLAQFTPSLSANTNFGSANTAFAIRGFVQDIGTQPSVGIYFADVVAPRGAANNVPIGDGAGPGDFFDLQNVQVLKGPQGTLFGRNTTGGAVLLVPQKPTGEFEGYAEGSAGNYNLQRIQAVLNAPLSDTARFRLGIDHQTRDGYLKNNTGIGASRYGDIEYLAARASLVLDLTPNLENYTVATYTHSDTTGDVNKLIACNPSPPVPNPASGDFGLRALAFGLSGPRSCEQVARETAKGSDFYTVQSDMPNPNTDLKVWRVINTTTWSASDSLTVKNIISYAELKESFRAPLFGTDWRLPFPALFNQPFYFAVNNPIPGRNTADQSTFTEELRLQGNSFGGALTWQGGAYLELSDPLALGGNFTPGFLHCDDPDTFNCTAPVGTPLTTPPGPGLINYTANKTRFRNAGLYAQATYNLTDQLMLTGGLRHTEDRVRTEAHLSRFVVVSRGVGTSIGCTFPGDSTPAPDCARNLEEKSSAQTWVIGLDYKPTEDILLYGKYTRGYRAGGLSPQAPVAFLTFEPEQVDTYETGVKTIFGGPMPGTVSIAAFYNDFQDQQLQVNLLPNNVAIAPASAILNLGKSRIYGAELEASVNPFTGFTMDASYAYLSTKVSDVKGFNATDPNFQISSPTQEGDELILSPKHKLALTGTYVLPLNQSIGEVSLSATYVYTSKQLANYNFHALPGDATATDLSYLDSRDLLNVNLNWNSIAGAPVDVGLFATNVTDEEYYSFMPGIYGYLAFQTASIGAPRMYGARVRYRFGAQ